MRRFLPLILLLLLGGCGYQLSGRGTALPADVQTLHIELFANRTAEPYLENRVTDATTSWFARPHFLQLVEQAGAADAVLGGTVSAYSTAPISYDRSDVITEYRSIMTVDAVLRRSSDGRVLWKGQVEWSEEYPASLDKGAQEDNEAAAIDVIAERVAQEIYTRILESF